MKRKNHRMFAAALAALLALALPAQVRAAGWEEEPEEPPYQHTAEDAVLYGYTEEELAAYKAGQSYAPSLYAPVVENLFAQTGGYAGGMLRDLDGNGSPELLLTWPVGNDWYFSLYGLKWQVKSVRQEGSPDPELKLTAVDSVPLLSTRLLYTQDGRSEAWVGAAGWTWDPPEPEKPEPGDEEAQKAWDEWYDREPEPQTVYAVWQHSAQANVSDVTEIRLYHPGTLLQFHTLRREAVYTRERRSTVLSGWVCEMDGMECSEEDFNFVAGCLTPAAVVYPGAKAQAEPRQADCWQQLEELRGLVTGLPAAPADYIAPGVFLDVSMDSWYFTSVGWAYSAGITEGTGYGLFSPEQVCSTAEVLTFLWREEGCPEPYGANPFSNVTETDWYYKSALWAYGEGLVSGTWFPRGEQCTRAALVTDLWMLSGRLTGAENPFWDVPLDAPYYDAVGWALERGITEGVSDREFDPYGVCTRAQVVTFLHRYSRMWLW